MNETASKPSTNVATVRPTVMASTVPASQSQMAGKSSHLMLNLSQLQAALNMAALTGQPQVLSLSSPVNGTGSKENTSGLVLLTSNNQTNSTAISQTQQSTISVSQAQPLPSLQSSFMNKTQDVPPATQPSTEACYTHQTSSQRQIQPKAAVCPMRLQFAVAPSSENSSIIQMPFLTSQASGNLVLQNTVSTCASLSTQAATPAHPVSSSQQSSYQMVNVNVNGVLKTVMVPIQQHSHETSQILYHCPVSQASGSVNALASPTTYTTAQSTNTVISNVLSPFPNSALSSSQTNVRAQLRSALNLQKMSHSNQALGQTTRPKNAKVNMSANQVDTRSAGRMRILPQSVVSLAGKDTHFSASEKNPTLSSLLLLSTGNSAQKCTPCRTPCYKASQQQSESGIFKSRLSSGRGDIGGNELRSLSPLMYEIYGDRGEDSHVIYRHGQPDAVISTLPSEVIEVPGPGSKLPTTELPTRGRERDVEYVYLNERGGEQDKGWHTGTVKHQSHNGSLKLHSVSFNQVGNLKETCFTESIPRRRASIGFVPTFSDDDYASHNCSAYNIQENAEEGHVVRGDHLQVCIAREVVRSLPCDMEETIETVEPRPVPDVNTVISLDSDSESEDPWVHPAIKAPITLCKASQRQHPVKEKISSQALCSASQSHIPQAPLQWKKQFPCLRDCCVRLENFLNPINSSTPAKKHCESHNFLADLKVHDVAIDNYKNIMFLHQESKNLSKMCSFKCTNDYKTPNENNILVKKLNTEEEGKITTTLKVQTLQGGELKSEDVVKIGNQIYMLKGKNNEGDNKTLMAVPLEVRATTQEHSNECRSDLKDSASSRCMTVANKRLNGDKPSIAENSIPSVCSSQLIPGLKKEDASTSESLDLSKMATSASSTIGLVPAPLSNVHNSLPVTCYSSVSDPVHSSISQQDKYIGMGSAKLLASLAQTVLADEKAQNKQPSFKPAPCPVSIKPVPYLKTHQPVPCSESNKPVPCPNLNKPAPCPETNKPVPCPETNKPVPCPESIKPVPCPESIKSVNCPESIKPVLCPESVKPVSYPESDKPVPCSESVKPVPCSESVKPVPCSESVKPLPCPSSIPAAPPHRNVKDRLFGSEGELLKQEEIELKGRKGWTRGSTKKRKIQKRINEKCGTIDRSSLRPRPQRKRKKMDL